MVTENWKDIKIDGIKGILWDLDNTLYLYSPAHEIAYNACKAKALSDYGIEFSKFDIHWNEARKIVHHDLHGQGASHSRLLYLQKFHELCFGKTDTHFALILEETYWSVFIDAMIWRTGAFELMKKAAEAGIEMAIVTDLTAHVQLRKFNRLELGRFVRFLISSEEAGKEKPEPEIFRLALKKLNLEAHEVIMIGDSMEKDIKGAQNMGIRAYLIDEKTI